MFIVDEITKMDVFTLYRQSLGAVGGLINQASSIHLRETFRHRN